MDVSYSMECCVWECVCVWSEAHAPVCVCLSSN